MSEAPQVLVFHPDAFQFVYYGIPEFLRRNRNWGKGRSRAAAKRRKRRALLPWSWQR